MPGFNDEELLTPHQRDSHLFLIADSVLGVLKRQRLTCGEILAAGRVKDHGVFKNIDEDLLWRGLMYAERKRWVTKAASDAASPRDSQWDLTDEGQTQASLIAMLNKRAKYGAILGLIAVVALGIGVKERTAVRWVGGALVFFAVWFFVQVGLVMKGVRRYALPAVKQREADVQDARLRSGIDPWWPVLEYEPRAEQTGQERPNHSRPG
jgi:hypothetical protein